MAALAGSGFLSARAADLKITIPRPSQLTPVQRLNREGVEAIRKHAYDKAEAIFYKAYLYDPADPFTLNNLGYISELQGQLDRAEKFYAMATKQAVGATIALSSQKQLQGKPMTYALDNLSDAPMRVNRMNFDAITLLSENRNTEGDQLLQHALALDSRNSFTLNNLGVANEAMGDYETALRYYDAAAASRSREPVIVTPDDAWRGVAISRMAAENARSLRARLQSLESAQIQAAMFNTRGVSAMNENNWQAARQDFLKAYQLNPYSAFSLNNAGYVAEHEGDMETAQFFYARAREAADADARVGSATRRLAAGTPLVAVASDNNQQAEEKLEQQSQKRHQQKGPVELLHRNGTPVVTSQPPPGEPSPSELPSPAIPPVPEPQS
jgi:tetratricopeptide (TPR) repeat protein